jgi:murein DD-endopeptidase MepM/ murein hydrolase activator NlpD
MIWILGFLLLNTTHVYTLNSGESVDKVLQRARIPGAINSQIISALKTKINLRKCRTGEKFYITTDQDRFVELKYEQAKVTWIVDSLTKISRVKEETKLLYLEGTIEDGSLWNAVISAGGTPRLIYDFANDVFAWDLDFNTETRNGDQFAALASAKYVGNRFIGFDRILLARYTSKYRKREFVGAYHAPDRGYFDLKGKSMRRAFLRAPLRYRRISSGYTKKRFHPILRRYRPHLGVDYAAPKGTPVSSIGAGRVTFAGWRRGFGKQVIIQHPNGYKSYYAHLCGFKKGIRKGKPVEQGQIVGYVGSTGLSTGPHLDFRLKRGKSWINPLTLDPPRVTPLRGAILKKYQSYTKKLLTVIDGMKTIKKLSPLLITHS